MHSTFRSNRQYLKNPGLGISPPALPLRSQDAGIKSLYCCCSLLYSCKASVPASATAANGASSFSFAYAPAIEECGCRWEVYFHARLHPVTAPARRVLKVIESYRDCAPMVLQILVPQK